MNLLDNLKGLVLIVIQPNCMCANSGIYDENCYSFLTL